MQDAEDMFLVFLTLSCVLLASSALDYKMVCYGDNYRIPSSYIPPLYHGPLYLTPSEGGSRRLLMDNGEAKDPRLKVSSYSATLTDLRKSDNGTLSVSFSDQKEFTIIRLHIRDCARRITKYYGSVWEERVPLQAAFLEFTPIDNPDQVKILWNRTDPQANKGGRGRVKKNVWRMSDLTQADNGFYNFKKKDNTLNTRLRLEVKERYENYDEKVKERLLIRYPHKGGPFWNVTFEPKLGTESTTVMKGGGVVREENWFSGRIQGQINGLEIDPLEITDAGVFLFTDPQGNKVLRVQVEVEVEEESSLTEFTPSGVSHELKYVAVAAVLVLLVIVCCCCFCCKKKRSKRESAPQTAATPAVYYHDLNEGSVHSVAPSALSSSHHPPAYSVACRGPTNISPEPPAYHLVSTHVNPSQPEGSPSGGRGSAPAPSTSSDFLPSDYEPKFELKGLSIPSAPPLSSDTTFSHVYHSDKLNF